MKFKPFLDSSSVEDGSTTDNSVNLRLFRKFENDSISYHIDTFQNHPRMIHSVCETKQEVQEEEHHFSSKGQHWGITPSAILQ